MAHREQGRTNPFQHGAWHLPGVSVYQVGGAAGGECFAVLPEDGGGFLVDAGYAWDAADTFAHLSNVCDPARIEWILLTHSHYDHCAGAAYLYERMPQAKLACAPYAARVFKRPGALRTMNKLNANEAANQGRTDFPHVPDHMPIDVLIDEGDTVASGGMTLSVMAAPGHTKDCLAFWGARSRLLVSCETSCVYGGPVPQGFVDFDGNPAPDDVSCLADTAFLVGWRMSLDYIDRAIAHEPEYVLVPHYGIMSGEEGRGFLRSARYFTQYAADLIVRGHEEGLSNDEVQARYKDFFYTDFVKSIQPDMAFDLNASYTVPLVIKERCGE